MEGYIGVAFGVKESNDRSVLDQYVPDLFNYISTLCTVGLSTSLTLLKAIADLMGDLAIAYGRDSQSLLTKEFVPHIIKALEASSLKTHQESAARLQSALTHVLSLR